MAQRIELEEALDGLLSLPDVSGEITMLFEQARNENGGSLHASQLYHVFADGVRRLVRKLEPVQQYLYLPEDRAAYERTLFNMKIGECAKTPYGTKAERVPNGWLFQMRNSSRAVFVPEHCFGTVVPVPETEKETVPS